MSKQDYQELNNKELLEKYQRLLLESESLAARLSLINEISNTITSLAKLEDVFKVIVTKLKWVLDYHSCSICILSEDRNHYTIHTHFDTKRVIFLEDKHFKAGYGIAGWVMEKGEPLTASNIKEEPRSNPSIDSEVFGEDIKSVLSLPLRVDGKVIGSLNLGSKRTNAYSNEDMRMAYLIGLQVDIALKNSRLLEQLRKANYELESAKKALELTIAERTAVFQALPDLFFRLDTEGTILDYNAGSTTDLYPQPKELLGKRIQDTPLEKVGNKFHEAIHQVQKTKSMVSIEYSLMIQNCEYFYEARLLSLLENQIMVIVRNITERKRVEEEVRNLAKFPSENPYPVLRVAKDGIVLHGNQASQPLLNVWECQVGKLLPETWRKVVSNVFNSRSRNEADFRVLITASLHKNIRNSVS